VRRDAVKRTSVLGVLLATMAPLIVASTCIYDPDDSTPPTVSLAVLKDGTFKQVERISYSHSTAQKPVDIICGGYDENGVKSLDLRFSSTTVDQVNCLGSLIPGSYEVTGLPSPDISTPQQLGVVQLYSHLQLSGGIGIAELPPGESQCSPATGSTLTVKCVAQNYSSALAGSQATAFLTVEFVNMPE
jgi:hypothetical protein